LELFSEAVKKKLRRIAEHEGYRIVKKDGAYTMIATILTPQCRTPAA